MMTRREWLRLTSGGALGITFASGLAVAEEAQRVFRDYELPLFDLPGQIDEPVRIESVELLRRGNLFFVRMRSSNGAVGLIQTKQVENYVRIFERTVAPHFVGRDARDLESLIDEVQLAHYKEVGLPFWVCVAYCEQATLDLLGKVTGKPVGALLGGVLRTEIPMYLSGSGRALSAEEEVDVYVRGVAETGARAVKFKIGGRMSGNLDAYPGRTETLIDLSREKLGNELTLYADANGSYDPQKAIEIGHILEAHQYSFFEEPCPFEALTETQAVKKALTIPIAAGEQDSSLWRFQWMIRNGVMDIVQPDINYNGGLIRALRVARMAEKAGIKIVPHNTQTGAASVNILQFASCTPNIGPFMEYPWRRPQQGVDWHSPQFLIQNGHLAVPQGPGFGVEIDPAYLAQCKIVVTVS